MPLFVIQLELDLHFNVYYSYSPLLMPKLVIYVKNQRSIRYRDILFFLNRPKRFFYNIDEAVTLTSDDFSKKASLTYSPTPTSFVGFWLLHVSSIYGRTI